MARGSMGGVLGLLLLPGVAAAAAPEPSRGHRPHTLIRVGVSGSGARLAPGADRDGVPGVSLAPALGLTVWGGDWFLKVDLGGLLATGLDAAGAPAQRPLGGGATRGGRAVHAHDFPTAFGALEIGAHWPTGPGALAVGLVVEGPRRGAHARDRDGAWLVGGDGVEVGASLHYAFEVRPGLRLDPELAAGAGVLWGAARSSGVWARARVQVFFQVAPHISLHGGLGGHVARYGDQDEGTLFTSRALTFSLGVALHGLFGIGQRDL